jgi:hypothetical protein
MMNLMNTSRRLRTGSKNKLPCALVIAFGLFVVLLLGQRAASADSRNDVEVSQAGVQAVFAAETQLTAASVLTPTQWTPPSPAYRIGVATDGLYSLSYSYLQTAGLPVDSLDPRTFRMFYLGREMAIQVLGEADGVFNSGDAVLFYGRGIDSMYYEGTYPDHKYTGTNQFWLTYGGVNGKRMALKDGSVGGTTPASYLASDHREQQLRYVTEYPRYDTAPMFNPDDDHWFWIKWQTLGTTVRTQNIVYAIDNLAPGSGATVTARVVGAYKDPNLIGNTLHGLRIRVNGQLVYQNLTTWKNFEPLTASAAITPGVLVNGNNTVALEFVNINTTVSEQYSDWVRLSYQRAHVATGDQLNFLGESSSGPWRYSVSNFSSSAVQVFDVTDLHNVQAVGNATVNGVGPFTASFGDSSTGRRYLTLATGALRQPATADIALVSYPTSAYTPDNLLATNNAADWIVITHRDFWTATLPLAVHRDNLYRVAMVDVQQIYDQFNGGMVSVNAIQDFLEYAYFNWQSPRPKFVLLGGGGTNDVRRYGGANTKVTYVPTYLYPSDPTLGETSADNRYVLFEGNDLVPDMHLGRFPAYSATEISIMVNKTIHYETMTDRRDPWTQNVLFVADDLEGGGGNFYEFSDTLADGYDDPANTVKYLPNPYNAIKVYLGQTCDAANPTFATQCRNVISTTLQIDGALFLSYVGHAQRQNWAVEKLMDLTLASTLTNYDKLSIFLPMACFEGFFHEAPLNSRSLSETYLFNPNGGAVASWSPTGFGVATGHDYLEKGLFLAVFTDQVATLGEATTAGKQYLHNRAPAGAFEDLLDTFVLLGDPALQVQSYLVPTAVTVASLAAYATPTEAIIVWETVNEANVVGFNVLRRDSAAGSYVKINDQLLPAQVAGGSHGASYVFVDVSTTSNAPRWYAVEVVRVDGYAEVVGLAETIALNSRIYLPMSMKP